MASILDEFLILFKPTVQGNGFQQLNKQIKQTHEGLFSMKNLFGAFVGFDIYSGLKQFGASLVNATREMGAMQSRFYAITGDMSKANDQLEWAFKLAERTAMPMKSLADSYSIFYAATQKGLGDAGAQQVFQDWTEVSRVLHMSEYQFERVTYALREMASKGVVYSQDLRMQIGTHVPNAVGLAEKAVNDLGITGTDWFEKFQKQSKGNQKMINEFLKLFSKYAKEQFADPEALKKAMQMPDAQIARLQNQWSKIRFGIAESGFGDDLAKVLTKLNDTLDKMTDHSKEIYTLLKDIVKIVMVLMGFKLFSRALAWLGKIGPKLFAIGKFFKRLAHPIKSLKALFRFGKLKFLDKIFGKGAGGLGKALLKQLGLKGLMKWVGKRAFFGLIGKGILALLGPIGAVISALWIIWDVLTLIWDILKIKYPAQCRAIKFAVLGWWNNFVGDLGIFFKVTIPGWIEHIFNFFKEKWNATKDSVSNWWHDLWNKDKDKDKVKFPGVTPDTNSWEYVQKQNMLPLSNYAGGQQYNFNPTISYENNINADGLSQEEATKLFSDALANNNQDMMSKFASNIGGSKNIT